MPTNILVVEDFDGVYNPLCMERTWVADREMNELDIAFPSVKDWKWYHIPIDNKTHYDHDREERVTDSTDHTYTVRWSSELVKDMNDVISPEHVETVSLSTWKADFPNLLAPILGLSLEQDYYIPPVRGSGHRYYMNDYDHRQMGKVKALEDWLIKEYDNQGEDRPYIIWVDDVATELYAGEDNELFRSTFKTDGIAIQTNGMKGLSRAEVEMIRSIIGELS